MPIDVPLRAGRQRPPNERSKNGRGDKVNRVMPRVDARLDRACETKCYPAPLLLRFVPNPSLHAPRNVSSERDG